MKFLIYKDVKGEWRWKLTATNGNVIADSGEGYKNRGHAVEMVAKLIDMDTDTVTVEFQAQKYLPKAIGPKGDA